MRSGKEIGSIVAVENEISMITRRKANERQKKGEGEAEEAEEADEVEEAEEEEAEEEAKAKAKTRRIQSDRKWKGRRGPNVY